MTGQSSPLFFLCFWPGEFIECSISNSEDAAAHNVDLILASPKLAEQQNVKQNILTPATAQTVTRIVLAREMGKMRDKEKRDFFFWYRRKGFLLRRVKTLYGTKWHT